MAKKQTGKAEQDANARRIQPGSQQSKKRINKSEVGFHKLGNVNGPNVFVLGEETFLPVIQHWIKFPGKDKNVPVLCGGMTISEPRKSYPDECPFCRKLGDIYEAFPSSDDGETKQWRAVAKTLWPVTSYWIWAAPPRVSLDWEGTGKSRKQIVKVLTTKEDQEYINGEWDVLALTEAMYRKLDEAAGEEDITSFVGLAANFERGPSENNPAVSVVKTVEFEKKRFGNIVLPELDYEPKYDADGVNKLYVDWEQYLDQLAADTVV